MNKKKKTLVPETMPEFDAGIESMPLESKIFVDKSLEIGEYIFRVMEQKGMKQKDLAEKMGKSEAEISKLLAGMHNFTLRSVAKLEAALGCTIICTPAKSHYTWSTIQMIHGGLPVTVKKSDKGNYDLNYDTKVIRMQDINARQLIQKAR